MVVNDCVTIACSCNRHSRENLWYIKLLARRNYLNLIYHGVTFCWCRQPEACLVESGCSLGDIVSALRSLHVTPCHHSRYSHSHQPSYYHWHCCHSYSDRAPAPHPKWLDPIGPPSPGPWLAYTGCKAVPDWRVTQQRVAAWRFLFDWCRLDPGEKKL